MTTLTTEARDPRKDPKAGDIVRHSSSVMPFPGPPITVEAVIGNLVGFTSNASSEVYWETRVDWCSGGPLTASWEVLHVAD